MNTWQITNPNPSLSARRAWIEILSRDADGAYIVVALRKESVDRNNTALASLMVCTMVALRKESVDRNRCLPVLAFTSFKSLSARRAWIEISAEQLRTVSVKVALRKESVDRN